jgi:hypothetical protein
MSEIYGKSFIAMIGKKRVQSTEKESQIPMTAKN